MPFDFDALPTYEPTAQEKLPTLRQFLKTVGTKKLPNLFPVYLVWVPGKFNNYTLQTEKFRAQVTSDNPLFSAIPKVLEASHTEEITFAIEILDRTKVTFRLRPTKEQGSWEAIGDSGWKFVQN